MRVVVMGAGAVGCYFGGLLAHAGHHVTFIGRQAHVEAINKRGLVLDTPTFTGSVAVDARTDASSLSSIDLVLFCTKSADTEMAGASLEAFLGSDATVLSLQNGVDNAERLSSVLNRPVVPAVVYVGAEMVGPGHVKHHGRGDLVIGSSSSSDALAQTLSEAKIPTKVSKNIIDVLWAKLIANCAWNALSAIATLPYGAIVTIDGATELITTLVRECEVVAKACGVSVPDDMLARVLESSVKMPNQLSSTAQDLIRGKPSEVDYLNGYIVRKGREKGIETPANRALQVMVKLVEQGRNSLRS